MNSRMSWINRESAPGLLLMAAALLAMVLSNSSWASAYRDLFTTSFSVRLGETFELSKPVLLWINDGLMAVFFLVVALELKRELLEGALSSWSKITLPLGAAIGGIIFPSAIYFMINIENPEFQRGWAIPAATDIAFALGILSLVGDRVPKSLRVFLLSLAIFDDLGAILIIAAFYTEDISWTAKSLALLSLAVLILFNRLRITRLAPYFLVGIFMWVCVLKSGVHATLAGVMLGLTIPLRAKTSEGYSPLRKLEHELHSWVAFAIIPVFAFANAGVNLSGLGTDVLFHPIALGIFFGLVFGKVLGVFGVSILMIKLKLAKFPTGANVLSLFAVSLLAGIGFTMSLFIGTLAFESTWMVIGVPVRIGVLGASLVSAILGLVVLLKPTGRKSTLVKESLSGSPHVAMKKFKV